MSTAAAPGTLPLRPLLLPAAAATLTRRVPARRGATDAAAGAGAGAGTACKDCQQSAAAPSLGGEREGMKESAGGCSAWRIW
eukprot:scaffold3713_cov372-Prasinococcus_capsulatus_cf.AAC.4